MPSRTIWSVRRSQLLQPGRNFEEILPLGLVGSLEKAIASYLPLAAERLGGLLEDPDTRERFESTIHDLLQRFLRDLKFHQRVVARVVMTEDTIDKVLDTIEAEGAERLSEILRDPCGSGSDRARCEPGDRRLPAAPGDGGPGRSRRSDDGRDPQDSHGWVVTMARDSATREFLLEKLNEGMEKAGARTWGEVLERVPTEKIADFLTVAARTDVARKAVETGAQRLISRTMDRPIGTPARWFPEDGPQPHRGSPG